jgi:uncharacterized protein (DUF302 family)
MAIEQSAYGMRVRTARSYEDAVAATRQALKQQGFGVITEIDVRRTLREKLGVDFRPYVILGACNPPLVHEALQAELEIGLLLPCNVIVYEDDGGCVVAAMDPKLALGVIRNPRLQGVATRAREKLEAALQAVQKEA